MVVSSNGPSLTSQTASRYPGLRFATVTAREVRQGRLRKKLNATKTGDARDLAARSATILDHASRFDQLFASAGFDSPLSRQVRVALDSGLPEVPPLVGALLRCELATGVLMGVQDEDRVDGALCLDVAADGESFEGMRSQVTCREGELVVRDAAGIMASVFQGPDRRTQVSKTSENVVFLIFDAPQLGDAFSEATNRVAALLEDCAASVVAAAASVDA
jgi:DNA/RNA-binding domain of Phe-tRNA-synthetase-like protein